MGAPPGAQIAQRENMFSFLLIEDFRHAEEASKELAA